jgi:hypothetical protein
MTTEVDNRKDGDQESWRCYTSVSTPETHFPRQTHQERRLLWVHQASSSTQQNKPLYSPIHTKSKPICQPLILYTVSQHHLFTEQAYLSRRFRLLFMNLVKELLESILKGLVFGPLVEFAHEMSAGAEGVVAKSQGSIAEILPSRKKRPLLQPVYTFKMMRRRRRKRREKDY